MHTGLFLSLILFVPQLPQEAKPIPTGSSEIKVNVGSKVLTVFTYKPMEYNDGPLIVVFHGTNRNADEYRDFAKGMADRFGALIAAPLFDSKQFSNNLYHNGGLLKEKKVAPQEEWTGNMTPKIAAEVRRLEGRPKLPYYFIGHSAGGQFLSRISGFVAPGAVRIVPANPGAHLFPTRDMPYPYGFGELPKELNDDDAIRLYLAQPLTIYVGTADTGKAQLPVGEVAMKQGPNRYERGKNCYKFGKDLAAAKGWTFHWRIVEAPGIDHNGKGMFDHVNSIDALFGIPPTKAARPRRILEPLLIMQ